VGRFRLDQDLVHRCAVHVNDLEAQAGADEGIAFVGASLSRWLMKAASVLLPPLARSVKGTPSSALSFVRL